ncbi:olfactory receptor 11A1-like [Dendropsophus ebraccatus]|uniref:olfactory receptor 11A1-like n=1 Tax=Dendropsophus ebraccatus TaxID=150705 RepID=UPI00383182F9
MCFENETRVTQIRMIGFQSLYKYRSLLFIVFLLTYLFILVGNLLIILLVTIIDHLKIPMYFFLKHLSIADILATTSVVPMMLDTTFVEEGVLPLWGCILQLYIYAIIVIAQCYLIAVMSYDRYLAICHPLRYSSLMGPHLCLRLVIWSWLLSGMLMLSEILVVIQLNFCGSNSIDHFFCDFGPTMALATSDTSSLFLQDLIISIFTSLFPFSFIIVTYICIFYTILKISSTHSRKKAFSTCSSHLITVCMYYGAVITIYSTPSYENTSHINKYITLLYIIVTPLMNPIVYSLRNKEIKRAMQKLISRIFLNGWRR